MNAHILALLDLNMHKKKNHLYLGHGQTFHQIWWKGYVTNKLNQKHNVGRNHKETQTDSFGSSVQMTLFKCELVLQLQNQFANTSFCPVSTDNPVINNGSVKTHDRSASVVNFTAPPPVKREYQLLSVILFLVFRKLAATEKSAPTKWRTNVAFVVGTTPTAAPLKEPSPEHQRKLVRKHGNY